MASAFRPELSTLMWCGPDLGRGPRKNQIHVRNLIVRRTDLEVRSQVSTQVEMPLWREVYNQIGSLVEDAVRFAGPIGVD